MTIYTKEATMMEKTSKSRHGRCIARYDMIFTLRISASGAFALQMKKKHFYFQKRR